MKKILPLLLAALLAFGLCGCAGSDAPDEPEATQVVEEPDYVPAFSDAESAAMASFMNKNRALIYESALYTFDFDGEYRPVLARYTPDGESVILADDCVPEFLLPSVCTRSLISSELTDATEPVRLTFFCVPYPTTTTSSNA